MNSKNISRKNNECVEDFNDPPFPERCSKSLGKMGAAKLALSNVEHKEKFMFFIMMEVKRTYLLCTLRKIHKKTCYTEDYQPFGYYFEDQEEE